ncbi:hypothetical protein KPH14_008028 [Odynerus spinipes]|uniref:Uncharacterized protein n=1 Tax=Odynerus spinipes TaxID=1348599 RepID=A0AAD9RK62_9HYME|nr:hypothetical protein KPH14_008028 [Odynerus spinipes]
MLLRHFGKSTSKAKGTIKIQCHFRLDRKFEGAQHWSSSSSSSSFSSSSSSSLSATTGTVEARIATPIPLVPETRTRRPAQWSPVYDKSGVVNKLEKVSRLADAVVLVEEPAKLSTGRAVDVRYYSDQILQISRPKWLRA